jgi:hypothetical protein
MSAPPNAVGLKAGPREDAHLLSFLDTGVLGLGLGSRPLRLQLELGRKAWQGSFILWK